MPERREHEPGDFNSGTHAEYLSCGWGKAFPSYTHDQHAPYKHQAPSGQVVVNLRIRPQREHPCNRQRPHEPTAGLPKHPRPHCANRRAHDGPDEGGAFPDYRRKHSEGDRLLIIRNADLRNLKYQLDWRLMVNPSRPERRDETDCACEKNDLVLLAEKQREEEQQTQLRFDHHQRPTDRGKPVPAFVKRVVHEQGERGKRKSVLQASETADEVC